jgi:hypothetical protein
LALYTREEEVTLRLRGKVRFTESDDDENKMPLRLLRRLINEAEGDVEQELSTRYFIPFQTDDGKKFDLLPERPTKEFLRTLCEIKSVLAVLDTDFGRGTVVDGSKYAERLKERYDEMIKRATGRREVDGAETMQWKFPPMTGLKLAVHNSECDDGYMGQIFNTSQGDGDYPQKQINDPGETWWTGTIDP